MFTQPKQICMKHDYMSEDFWIIGLKLVIRNLV